VQVLALDDGQVRARSGGLQTRQGQTALGAADGDAVGAHQARVDDVAAVTAVLVVGAVVDEHPQRHADLAGGQADAVRRVHRREQVLDQPGQRPVGGGDRTAGRVQDRVAVHPKGVYAAGSTRNGPASHGRKPTSCVHVDDLRRGGAVGAGV
jgi:hypothetical protein